MFKKFEITEVMPGFYVVIAEGVYGTRSFTFQGQFNQHESGQWVISYPVPVQLKMKGGKASTSAHNIIVGSVLAQIPERVAAQTAAA